MAEAAEQRRPRRTVTLCGPHITPRLGPTRLWAYGYADLARLFCMSRAAVRKAVQRGSFDPASLPEIIDFYMRQRPRGR
jgi:hypothetical protein